LKQFNYKDAQKSLTRAISLDPNFAYAYNNRGYARLMLGDLNSAYDDINTSIRLEKANSYAYRNLGLYYLKTGRKNEACQEFNKAIKFGFRDKFGEEVDNLLKVNCE
jgi:Flp pilus assembly protein TadD